jgi:hypothetical protein
MDVTTARRRSLSLASSCLRGLLRGLLATGIALAFAWLDAHVVALAWQRCEVGIGTPANGFVLLVEMVPTTLAYLVVLVLADGAAVRLGRGPGLWVVRLALVGAVLAVGSAVFFRLHDLPITNEFCVREPGWLPF